MCSKLTKLGLFRLLLISVFILLKWLKSLSTHALECGRDKVQATTFLRLGNFGSPTSFFNKSCFFQNSAASFSSLNWQSKLNRLHSISAAPLSHILSRYGRAANTSTRLLGFRPSAFSGFKNSNILNESVLNLDLTCSTNSIKNA